MNAKLAFTAISQIPLFGSRAAAISCCREAATNTLTGASTLPEATDAAEVLSFLLIGRFLFSQTPGPATAAIGAPRSPP
jgi:hypothetical protein